MKCSLILVSLMSLSEAHADGWTDTKNIADDIIYEGRSHTFYCGCAYTSDGDRDGSGRIDPELTCGFEGPSTHSHRAGRVEWEHIVPTSLMPTRLRECWVGPGGSRGRCEDSDPVAQAMIFDLHNLVPSTGPGERAPGQ